MSYPIAGMVKTFIPESGYNPNKALVVSAAWWLTCACACADLNIFTIEMDVYMQLTVLKPQATVNCRCIDCRQDIYTRIRRAWDAFTRAIGYLSEPDKMYNSV